ncbi:MAG: hypothetical protein SF097_06120 [Acidobacteriota bacterium]|nr:hypothetical protein [Acidobacteriota bacterium]
MRVALIVVLLAATVMAQDRLRRPREASTSNRQTLNKQIAARFAPIFYQGLGDNPRSDFITNFDFDGDWKGDNNWWNLDNKSFPLKAYIYYSVIETASHYFVHYAFFHPRDYKGGLAKTALLDTLMGEGLRRAGKDPTGGLANDVALSHENDLEGCLVVAEKHGGDPNQAVVQFVEAMAHNKYLKYCPREASNSACEAIEMDGERARIFIEPKGHGPERYLGDRNQLKNSINGVMIYRYTGRAENHDETPGKEIGYDLIPIYDTFWQQAQKGENETYGESLDYETRSFFRILAGKPPEKSEQKLGVLGVALRGTVGFKNKSRPPWGWFDANERDRPRGEWFFDPAAVTARHFNLGEAFSTAYVYNPYFKTGM